MAKERRKPKTTALTNPSLVKRKPEGKPATEINQGEKSSGTSGGTRTHTLVKEADFESAASTNSATLAIK